eukprot:2789668-Rhodomonas_salina.2
MSGTNVAYGATREVFDKGVIQDGGCQGAPYTMLVLAQYRAAHSTIPERIAQYKAVVPDRTCQGGTAQHHTRAHTSSGKTAYATCNAQQHTLSHSTPTRPLVLMAYGVRWYQTAAGRRKAA